MANTSAKYDRKIEGSTVGDVLGIAAKRLTRRDLLALRRGFKSDADYQNKLAIDRGFKSTRDYQNKLAIDKGFKSRGDYENKLAIDKGFKSRGDYQNKLAIDRGFKSTGDYQNKLAIDKGFKSTRDYQKHLQIERSITVALTVKYLIEIGKNEASFKDIAYILNQVQNKDMDEQKIKSFICGSFRFDDWGSISDDGNSFKLLKPAHPFLVFLLK